MPSHCPMGVEEGWPEAGGATEPRGRDGARSPGSGRNGVSAGVVGGRSCSGVTDAPVGLPAWPRRPSVQGDTLGWQEKGAPGRGGRGARDVVEGGSNLETEAFFPRMKEQSATEQARPVHEGEEVPPEVPVQREGVWIPPFWALWRPRVASAGAGTEEAACRLLEPGLGSHRVGGSCPFQRDVSSFWKRSLRGNVRRES